MATWIDVNTNLGTMPHEPEFMLDLNAIKNSIRNYFNCKRGSRLFRRREGNPLDFFIGEPITSLNARRILEVILQGLPDWEPRITLDPSATQVRVLPDNSGYYIDLRYIERTTNRYTTTAFKFVI